MEAQDPTPPHNSLSDSNVLLFYSKFFSPHRKQPMPDSFSADGLRRIRRLAFWVRAMCLVGLVVIGTLPFVFWAQPDWVAEVVGQFWGVEKFQVTMTARLGGLAASLLPVGAILFSLWQMWMLFGCFARGELLAQEPAAHLRHLGLGMCALPFTQVLGRTLAILALTWGNPKGERQLWVGFSADHYLALLFGLLLLALAQVLLEAARVADENKGFI